MKIQSRSAFLTIVCLVMIGVLISCHEDHAVAPPAVTGFAPASGYEGDTVVISGSNFNADTTTDAVTFNGTPAKIVKAGKTSLSVLVPLSVTTGKISITTNGKSVTSSSDFSVLTSVYVVGNVIAPDEVTATATYWQDGVKTSIPGVSGSTYLNSAFKQGKDIYYAGTYNDGNTVAAYWKNGVMTKLSNSNDHFTQATSLYVTPKGDIYVGGKFDDAAAYWKNGVVTLINDGTMVSQVYSIAVSGNDVYVAGAEESSAGTMVAKYWKNGTEKILSDGKQVASARSIVVSGGNVHVAGANGNEAMYWKNDVPTILSRPDSDDASAGGVFVSGNDVYICGGIEKNERSSGAYWKNGIATTVSDGTWISSIFIHDADIYMAGVSSKGTATYWKNQIATPLTDGKTQSGAFGIVVR